MGKPGEEGLDPNAKGGGTAEAEGEEGKVKGTPEVSDGLTLSDAVSALKDVRKEAAGQRKDNKSLREELDGLKTGIAKALGLKGAGDEDKADMKAVLEAVKDLKSKLSKADKKEAFATVAGKVGADADLSFAYLTAEGKLDDPDVDVEKLLKALLKQKPQLKATAAVKVGDEHKGGGGEKTTGMNAFIRRAAGKG